ncbi:hypothetical protein AAFF_G00269550 [Aldrovandia affinis]|uniref:Uncharacterized protein n=1 Tax=Aldrovandia affinis TaxID=143900 RepID=A0AAD7SSL0_9TELE|nr:hypothetical protein AAFF_G00269550 [Aldrovandia affinis]
MGLHPPRRVTNELGKRRHIAHTVPESHFQRPGTAGSSLTRTERVTSPRTGRTLNLELRPATTTKSRSGNRASWRHVARRQVQAGVGGSACETLLWLAAGQW